MSVLITLFLFAAFVIVYHVGRSKGYAEGLAEGTGFARGKSPGDA